MSDAPIKKQRMTFNCQNDSENCYLYLILTAFKKLEALKLLSNLLFAYRMGHPMPIVEARATVILFHFLKIIKYLPCFPKNNAGLILIFTLKYDIRAYFWECLLFSSIEKQRYKVENYEISKFTKNMKIFLLLILSRNENAQKKSFLS